MLHGFAILDPEFGHHALGSAVTGIISFMASTIATCCPARTGSPSATKDAAPGSGDR
ncbi:hypothetical protein [Nocardia sp. NPDC059239]|uniref:hypothetical protein n=1 Tax=Nocardia sp. NPDC059239 TaxID=3346785 RepID=UPI003679BFFA